MASFADMPLQARSERLRLPQAPAAVRGADAIGKLHARPNQRGLAEVLIDLEATTWREVRRSSPCRGWSLNGRDGRVTVWVTVGLSRVVLHRPTESGSVALPAES